MCIYNFFYKNNLKDINFNTLNNVYFRFHVFVY